MATATRDRHIGDIVSDLGNQIALLVRREGELATAEIGENFRSAMRGMVFALIGAVLLMPGFIVLLLAAVDALAASGMSDWLAALIVGGVVLVIGAILMLVGMNRLSADNLVPKKTMRQLRRDAAVPRMVENNDELQRAA